MAILVTPEEYARWQEHLNTVERTTGSNKHNFRKTPPEKVLKIREMIQSGESKNQIIKKLHVGVGTVDKHKRAMVREGIL